MAIKRKLGWVLMGGSKRNKREDWCNFLCDNSSFTVDQNIKTLEVRIIQTIPKLSSELLPADEKRSQNTLKNNRFETVLLWKSNVPHVLAN